MRIVAQLLVASGDSCFVAKKGKKYIGAKNGELCLVANVGFALAFADEGDLEKSFLSLSCDSRNAKVIGRSYSIVTISR